MEKLRKPIIAAVNGFANIELIQACDIVVAAEDASFALPETGIGVSPGAGITIRLPRVVGKFIAKELLFTGRPDLRRGRSQDRHRQQSRPAGQTNGRVFSHGRKDCKEGAASNRGRQSLRKLSVRKWI